MYVVYVEKVYNLGIYLQRPSIKVMCLTIFFSIVLFYLFHLRFLEKSTCRLDFNNVQMTYLCYRLICPYGMIDTIYQNVLVMHYIGLYDQRDVPKTCIDIG